MHRTYIAGIGAEALDFLFCRERYSNRKMENQPQLVLLDLNLPKVGGLEVQPSHQERRAHQDDSGDSANRVTAGS